MCFFNFVVKTKSTIFHDKVAGKYESGYSGPYWKLYHDLTFANIKKYLPKRGSLILDAGGGTGFWSRILAKLGYRLVCTDVSQNMLNEGIMFAKKERLSDKIEFKFADITNMKDFKSNFFDFVISEGDPVGYCGNPDKAISELSRVVKKNGFVIVSIDSFFNRLNRMVCKQDFSQLKYLESRHKTIFPGGGYLEHDFTVDELKGLFKKHNLEVVNIIGKPIFARSIPNDKIDKVLSDKKVFNTILNLELKYNSEPSIVGLGGHIQIVGRKI